MHNEGLTVGTESRIKKIIFYAFGLYKFKGIVIPSDVLVTYNLKSDLNADWLDLIETAEAIEYEFRVNISDDDIRSWVTVKDILDTAGSTG